MRAANSTDFKVKTLRTSTSANKKLQESKSDSVEEVAHTTSVSKLNSKLQEYASTNSNVGKPPRRPLTGRRNKEVSSKESHEVNNVENEEHMPAQIASQAIIDKLLQNSHKIKDFVAENSLSHECVAAKLSEPLFTISMVTFIHKNRLEVSEAESMKRLERFILEKLNQECTYQRQTEICGQKETKILGMIEQRLKRLSQL